LDYLLKRTDNPRQSGDWRSRHQKQKRPGKAGAQWSTEVLYHEGNKAQDRKSGPKERRVKTRSFKTEGCGTRRPLRHPPDHVCSLEEVVSLLKGSANIAA
jgi:hypothetical protein